MTTSDQTHWDEKYRRTQGQPVAPALPERFEAFADRFAAATTALEIACGAGAFSVWLAKQGVQVHGYDISPVVVASANELASRHDVADRCSFDVVDLDDGLPPDEPVDLIVCNMFRDARLDQAVIARLRPGGTLAIAALSEVDAEPGRFRVPPGELTAAFAELEVLAADEGDGVACLVAVKQ